MKGPMKVLAPALSPSGGLYRRMGRVVSTSCFSASPGL